MTLKPQRPIGFGDSAGLWDLWEVGHTVGNRWQIQKILRGGMGVVYIVHDQQDGQTKVIKTFRDELFFQNPQLENRFINEALAWVRLKPHPNVVSALRVEKFEGKPFLFLQFVGGGDLDRRLGGRCLPDMAQIARFGLQFCDGMQHLLLNGISAHRDIKPQNCLITADGNELKITDFGLAKIFNDISLPGIPNGKGNGAVDCNPQSPTETSITTNTSLTIGLTKTGVGAGTPAYMAPEQFDDAKRVNVQGDIYSFGIMLFQMVTGRVPFVGKDWQEFGGLHKREPVPHFDCSNVKMAEIIRTCLAKNPNERFSNFAHLRRFFAEIVEAFTGRSAPPPPIELPESFDAFLENDRAISLFQLGKRDEALCRINNYLLAHPHAWKGWSNKGRMLLETHKYEEALVCWDKALEINPQSDTQWSSKADTLFKLSRFDEALTCYERALEINPRSVPANKGKITTLRFLRRYVEANRYYHQLLRSDPMWHLRLKSG
jgi:serine/threonine protein kinase